MSIELLTGDAAALAGGESEFSGTINPRRIKVDEGLAARATTLLESAFANRWGADVRLAEAFSTSDFRLAAAAELDAEMLAQYDEIESKWEGYTDTTTVRDFRPKRLKSRYRGGRGMPRVPELTEYPADDQSAHSEYAISVFKHGLRKAISWEAWKNNEAVGELQDLPGDLARRARETEQVAAVSNLLKIDGVGADGSVTASDVNTAFFKTANGNAPDSKPLTRDNLKAAIDGMAGRKDPVTKRVVARPQVVVVIPQSLESTMLSIVSARWIRTTDQATGAEVEIANELADVSYIVEPLLDELNTHAKAATTWFVVPKPGGPRPALWTAKLAGHEAPDLRVKADTGQRVGGGQISALEGSFDIDDIQYRGRHIVGNQTGDALFTYVSRGA
jgi:hypothetical protein